MSVPPVGYSELDAGWGCLCLKQWKDAEGGRWCCGERPERVLLPGDQPTSGPNAALKADPVNHPAHYTGHPSGVECITITRHMNFNRGNAVKYIWRAGEKGSEIEDLRKAAWYVADEIARLERETNP